MTRPNRYWERRRSGPFRILHIPVRLIWGRILRPMLGLERTA